MSITLSTSQYESIMSKLESLEGLVQKSGAVAPSVPTGKAGKAKKTPKARDPSAPPKAPNAWILFTSRVRSVINESGVLGEKKLGKECTQFCSSLKEENAVLDSWTAETILARFSGWTVPEQSKMAAAGISFAKKNKGSEAAAPESEAAAEPAAVSEKPKRVISQEQKDKMRAGRERAAAAKKAAAAGSAPVAETPAPVAETAAAPVSAPAAAEAEEEEEWMPMKLKVGGVIKPFLWNPANNHCYNRESDGGQGEWAGVFNPKTKTIDSSVPEPSEDEDFEVLDA
jgi:hypothetical protein